MSRECSYEYFRIFNGEPASLKKITADNSNFLKTVEVLIDCGAVIGQSYFDEQGQIDTLLVKNEPNTTPLDLLTVTPS